MQEQLMNDLRRSFDGDAWHGPALRDVLDGVTATEAASRPIADAHSVWELVLHLASWAFETARRLDGAAPAEPVEGDWPVAGRFDGEQAWAAAKDRLLVSSRDAVLEALSRLPPGRLADRVGEARNDALGTGVTMAGLAAGLAQHNAYHGGQILLLVRAVRRGAR